MIRLAPQICLAAGVSATIAAAPIGSLALFQGAGSIIGPLNTGSPITQTTPATVPAISMAVPPSVKGPATLLPQEEEGP